MRLKVCETCGTIRDLRLEASYAHIQYALARHADLAVEALHEKYVCWGGFGPVWMVKGRMARRRRLFSPLGYVVWLRGNIWFA